jgi:hypothetical protein
MSEGFPEMRNRQIYLTAMVAATPAAAVAVILAATPTTSPANAQLSFNAAIQHAPLDDPCDPLVNGNCNIPGFPGNVNSDPVPGNANPYPVPGNVNPDPVPDIVASTS